MRDSNNLDIKIAECEAQLKANKVPKKPFRIPLWLICCYLLIAVIMLSGVTLAKYTAVATGSDDSRVAAIYLDAKKDGGNDLSFDASGIYPGGVKDFIFTVANNNSAEQQSEVTMSYTISVADSGNFDLNYSLSEYRNNEYVLISTGNSWNCNAFSISPTTVKYKLTVTWAASQNHESMADEIDCITVTVTASQLD